MGKHTGTSKFNSGNVGASAGAASILTGNIAKASAIKGHAEASIFAIEQQQEAIDQRGDLLLASISSKSKKFAGRQAVQYASQGVELSGSALDVIQDTIEQEHLAKSTVNLEISAQQQQLAMEKAVFEVESRFALVNGILSGMTQATSSLAKNSGS